VTGNDATATASPPYRRPAFVRHNDGPEVVLAPVEPDVSIQRTLAANAPWDVSMTDNTYVCLEQLANKIHTVLEVDLGVKVAVAIVPTKIGATRRVQVVHTARGWIQAAPRGSAMYGASDCAGASRRPLDAVMILDYQPVAGGYAPSGVVACQRAKRILRGTYRNACSGRTLGGAVLQGARSVAGHEDLHCLEFLCRTACKSFANWAAELSALCGRGRQPAHTRSTFHCIWRGF
jgi:hypothetical protein